MIRTAPRGPHALSGASRKLVPHGRRGRMGRAEGEGLSQVTIRRRSAMKGMLVLAVALGLLAAAPSPGADDAKKKEGEKFDGTWVAVSVVRDGREVPKEDVEKM